MGSYTAITADCTSRAAAPGIFEPNCPGWRGDYRRPDRFLHSRFWAARPRSTQHFERWRHCLTALAHHRIDQCLLRLGIYQWLSRAALFWRLPAAAHDL